ncbi:hypothetical protein [uncultured Granulicatella sp.]|jgi:hypothetical protein|uniref:hypothetical protein n=1 Tax=uncultured Granulicatella sp. TaxID=316089 RepID=UPI0026119B7B|nr:hypothetical protein [uncultured Granulicatella sp.]
MAVKKEQPIEVLMEVTPAQRKKMAQMANTVLKNMGIDPNAYWYEQQYKLVIDNIGKLNENKKGNE